MWKRCNTVLSYIGECCYGGGGGGGGGGEGVVNRYAVSSLAHFACRHVDDCIDLVIITLKCIQVYTFTDIKCMIETFFFCVY